MSYKPSSCLLCYVQQHLLRSMSRHFRTPLQVAGEVVVVEAAGEVEGEVWELV
jgi:hypothetical protein